MLYQQYMGGKMTPIKEIVEHDLDMDLILPGNAQDLCESINNLIDFKIEHALHYHQVASPSCDPQEGIEYWGERVKQHLDGFVVKKESEAL